MDYLEKLQNEALDTEHDGMEHEHAVLLFPRNHQAGDTDVDDGKSYEEDPVELRPEQDGNILPRGILLTNAELHRGRPMLAGLTSRKDESDSEAGESDDRGDRNEHEAPKVPCKEEKTSV